MKSHQTFRLVAALMLVIGVTEAFAGGDDFTPDVLPVGWIARPTLTSVDVSSNAELYFRGGYVVTTWRGDVEAYKVNYQDEVLSQIPDGWRTAAARLDDLNYDTGRKIVTMSGASKIPFRWASLSTTQQNAIDGDATKGQAILNYVRGDRSNEIPSGLRYRARATPLGRLADIIHSTLYYWKHGDGSERLYVGANDGMLHVFNARTGIEVYAYIPSMLIPTLKKLKDANEHMAFVDGPLTIAKVTLSGTSKTILVGGLRAGGKGLFALDVTDPSPASEDVAKNNILWEITPATTNFAKLGYTYGIPRIARLNDGTAVAIAGNGYKDGDKYRTLFIINLATGALHREIDMGRSGDLGGLSSPTLLDTNGDGKADYAYAGDPDGKLWKFDLTNFTGSLLYTTSPARPITVAPVVRPHPQGGYMVVFGTGRILEGDDAMETLVDSVYGIWDGAPTTNTTLLTQTLSTEQNYISGSKTVRVRTVTANLPNWSAGQHKGWKVDLPRGERVVGEAPFFDRDRYYFTSTNPTIPGNTANRDPVGDNWLNELDFMTGGAPSREIFDLNEDGAFTSADRVNGAIPVSTFITKGVLSQPVLVAGPGFTRTLFNSHDNLPGGAVSGGTGGPGVSGGHFDFDNYYPSTQSITYSPQTTCETREGICALEADATSLLNQVDDEFCGSTNEFSSDYDYLKQVVAGSDCFGPVAGTKSLNITCCTYTTTTTTVARTYANRKHVHQYDDKYNVTGVNMLNASLPTFNLENAIPNLDTEFKVLVMNQYLSPAALLSVGGKSYEKVQTYGKLAGPYDATKSVEDNAQILLDGLPVYTRNPNTSTTTSTRNARFIKTLIFNLPLDAFATKNWWDGEETDATKRAGLIPTQTGCVNGVNADGSSRTLGPNGERYNGALTIQLIKPDTPARALELNHSGGDVKYGWRVKVSNCTVDGTVRSCFSEYVLAEYTTFWHHPNGKCYGATGWLKNPPESTDGGDSSFVPTVGADPRDGNFNGGVGIANIAVNTVGDTTTTTITYANDQTYVKRVVTAANGDQTITETMPDGTIKNSTITRGEVILPPSSTGVSKMGKKQRPADPTTSQRESWRELTQ